MREDDLRRQLLDLSRAIDAQAKPQLEQQRSRIPGCLPTAVRLALGMALGLLALLFLLLTLRSRL